MLHLARRIPLRVNVGDLFELQRPFERNREVNAAAQIQKILRLERCLRQIVVDSGRCARTCSILPGIRISSCTSWREASANAPRTCPDTAPESPAP